MRPNLLAVDAHAHLYPAHRVDRWLASAMANLAALAGDAPAELVVALADTPRAEGFRRLADGPLPSGFHAERSGSGGPPALVLTGGAGSLYVLAGRQVVTRERLEVLALGTAATFDGTLSLDEALAAVRVAGATAVLPWSPGKWLGRRGRLVAAALERAVGDLVVADSSLRPNGFPLPSLLRRARRLGIPLVAGSDPLPPRAEENQVGRYGVVGRRDAARQASPDGEAPAAAIALLARGGALAGRRSGLPAVLWRWVRHRRSPDVRSAA